VPRPGSPGGAAGTGRPVTAADYARRSAVAWYLLWVGWWLLLLQQGADAWLQGAPWIIWLVKLLPLLIFLPGMLRSNLRSFIWLCFVSLLYFMTLVEALFARPGEALPVVGTCAVVLLFISAMLYVRWRARQLRAAAAPSEVVEDRP